MKRELTQAAQCAKKIRLHMKQAGIKCTIKSSNYSMGNSVSVTVFNQPPETMKKLNKNLSIYEYGHFDGMTDSYEYSNRRDDIPQTKYLHINNDISDDLRQAAWAYLRKHAAGADQYPAAINDVPRSARIWEQWATDLVWHLVSGTCGLDEMAKEFWAEWAAPKTEAPAPDSNSFARWTAHRAASILD